MPGLAEASERADPSLWRWRPGLELASQLSIERDERDMKTEVGYPVDPRQNIDVSRDQRTLGDHHHAQSGMLSQHFQNTTSDLEATLGRLVRICRRADHYGFAREEREVLVASVTKRAAQNLGRVVLDENVALEREPGRKIGECIAQRFAHLVVTRRSLHHVAVRVPGVAVGAAERAADVGIDGPETHARRFRTVQHALRRRAVVSDVLLNVEHGQPPRVSLELLTEERHLIEALSHRCLLPAAAHKPNINRSCLPARVVQLSLRCLIPVTAQPL